MYSFGAIMIINAKKLVIITKSQNFRAVLELNLYVLTLSFNKITIQDPLSIIQFPQLTVEMPPLKPALRLSCPSTGSFAALGLIRSGCLLR